VEVLNMLKRDRSPLSCIPPSSEIKPHLAEAERRVEQLKILLRTAEQIEAAGRQQERREAAAC
jgi:hypothetical protein